MARRIIQIFNNLINKNTVSDRGAGEEKSDFTVGQEPAYSGTEAGMRNEFVQGSVLNRKTFDRIVDESLSGGRKTGWLLVCNVDRFSNINDIYGRETGDAVMQSMAGVLRDVFGGNTCIGSPGGDVFMLWLPIVPESGACDIRRQVGMVNDRLLHPARDLPPVSVSAGAAFCRDEDDSKSIGKRANKALYLVKKSGRCGCEVSL